jgi:hypothetical protein
MAIIISMASYFIKALLKYSLISLIIKGIMSLFGDSNLNIDFSS